MADDQNTKPGPFDVQTVKLLVQLMSRHDLNEIDLRDGEQRICLRRGVQTVAVSAPAAAPMTFAAPSSVPAASVAAPAERPVAAVRSNLIEIKAPTVGTYYAQEKEGAPPYIVAGSRVTPTTVVGLIEAMKLFNEITAGCNGVIREILVDNQQPVEFDQVLFRIDPAA